ncbi:hypothetical protein GCM10027591_09580 [Zhihengliuella somnathii]
MLAIVVTLCLVALALPMAAVIGIPVLAAITVHHVVALCRTAQRVRLLAGLLALDLIALSLAIHLVAGQP